MFRGRFEKF